MILVAPLKGWSSPLEEVPDPVFAGRLLGDGVAIDPTDDVLHAPCDAEVVSVAAARHAITLRAEGGVEILLHVGIDTVALAGSGFELLTRAGARVRAGEPLLRFDLDLLACKAKSVLTPIVVMDDAARRIVRRAHGVGVNVGDFLMEVVTHAAAVGQTSESGAAEVVRRVRVNFAHGIHARPAAMLVKRARDFSATLRLEHGDRSANARSAVALMALGAGHGDDVRICASGTEAQPAAAALEALIAAGEGHAPSFAPTHARTSRVQPPARRADPSVLRGIAASEGIAVGCAVRIMRPEPQVIATGAGIAEETAKLERACRAVRLRLEGLARTDAGLRREVMLAHVELLADPEIAASAREWIVRGGSAGYAWRKAVRSHAEVLGAMSDPLIAERAEDLLDLEAAVLLELEGSSGAEPPELPDHAILIARDLMPSQLAALDADRLAGIGLAEGGPTSHVALLAAAQGVPMLVALGAAVLQIPDRAIVVLDAGEAALYVRPDAPTLQRAHASMAAQADRRAVERAAAMREARTQDGTHIEIFANVGSVAEAQAAVANGADGCGLLRTEFLFLDRAEPPDESEQTREYQRMADAFAGRPLVVRTLDVGGDKPIAYLPLPHEANPALGLRGVRASLWRSDLLRTQLAAVRRVRPAGQCRILLPMIVSAAEVRAVRRVLEESGSGSASGSSPLVGAMIETPAAAMLADQILHEADFLSIGTNDLTQYALAMDRGHPELAAQLDGLHPAVLRLMAATLQVAVARGRPVAVCGALAADPLAVPILIGLGVRELSVVPAAVPGLKALVRTLRIDACRALACTALDQSSAEAVRALSVAAAARTSAAGAPADGRTRGLA